MCAVHGGLHALQMRDVCSTSQIDYLTCTCDYMHFMAWSICVTCYYLLSTRCYANGYKKQICEQT